MAKISNGAYDPQRVEDRIYRRWEASGFFNPDRLPKRSALSGAEGPQRPFSIIMPPPNANGALHLGHAVFVTLQDILIRFWRMRGRKTLWLPGADHAGFETQVVFDKKLEKEGRNRADVPPGQLYKEMLAFTRKNKQVMEGQLRKLGASADWSREQFTLDPVIVRTVTDTFVKLYADGLLYRGERIVNWCVKHQTTLSDLEVKYEERADPLYFIQYGPFEIATARPETKFGDKYVVMHPGDKRYARYQDGERFEVEWINGRIRATVIKDRVIDMQFGTGAMTITPWHDGADYELAQRRKLDQEPIIDQYGRLLPVAGEFRGMKIGEARPKIVQKLKEKGLLTRIEPNYRHRVAVCYKCGNVVEPVVMPQWFVRMTAEPHAQNQKSKIKNQNDGRSLRDMAVAAVKSGKIKIIPKRYEKVYFHWLKNIRDWNISRQIIWGIRIPAWFRGDEIHVGADAPQGSGWVQDTDVLDTWFSSGQWPFATLLAHGAKVKVKSEPSSPEPQVEGKAKVSWTTKDFETYYPTDVMETGYDILFFWVARMVMLGLWRTGAVPFGTVYLHGLVRDQDRQKMSKSKGNVIDPLGVAELYGTDAVRMALTVGNLPGQDIVISEEKIRGYRNFANKLWNIQRFIVMRTKDKGQRTRAVYSAEDKKRLDELGTLAKRITNDLERFRFHHAAETLYHYTWHTFADKIIESAKPRLVSDDPHERSAASSLLLEIHSTLLKLLHPFMPFITEELWSHLPKAKGRKTKADLLMVEAWPQ